MMITTWCVVIMGPFVIILNLVNLWFGKFLSYTYIIYILFICIREINNKFNKLINEIYVGISVHYVRTQCELVIGGYACAVFVSAHTLRTQSTYINTKIKTDKTTFLYNLSIC